MRERERLVAVSWGSRVRTYFVPVRIHAYDRQGLMGDISTLLNNESINIADVNVKTNQNLADIKLIIEVRDIEQLSRILTRIENLPNVMEAQRTKPG
jgi:GTP pyrophosphokinase